MDERRVEETGEGLTASLRRWRDGESGAAEEVLRRVYGELRRLAVAHMRRERVGHTLQPTALVHEAYLRLGGLELEWRDRVHFLSLASRLMRRVLLDHARRRRAAKRGGGREAP